MKVKRERDFILCGDINIAHQQIDLKNWRSNQKNSGFLPEERAWMTKLLHTTDEGGGIIDVYRQLQPTATDTAYTWWSNRGQAYANNVGWRLDYHLATPALAALARAESIYKGEKFSDHAPITVDYDFSLTLDDRHRCSPLPPRPRIPPAQCGILVETALRPPSHRRQGAAPG
jgi:exodeoxyribonuclease-3